MKTVKIVTFDDEYIAVFSCKNDITKFEIGDHLVELRTKIIPHFYDVVNLRPVIAKCPICGREYAVHWTREGLRVFS